MFDRRKTFIDLASLPLFGPTKGNSLLSIWWEFRLTGFLDKTGRGWSRDAVIKKIKMKLKDILVMIGLRHGIS